MGTASLHARQHRHPAAEAGLWLVWVTARVTGLSHPLGAAGHWLARIPWRTAARHTVDRCRRVAVRAELAAADLLTGPVPELLDVATARLQRRTRWLLLAGAFLANLGYLALR